MELQELFGALSRLMHDAELVGAVDRNASSNVSGIKRLPVKLELSASVS